MTMAAHPNRELWGSRAAFLPRAEGRGPVHLGTYCDSPYHSVQLSLSSLLAPASVSFSQFRFSPNPCVRAIECHFKPRVGVRVTPDWHLMGQNHDSSYVTLLDKSLVVRIKDTTV